MRIRVILLFVLAAVLAGAAIVLLWHSAALSVEGQRLYGAGTDQTIEPASAVQDRANALFTQASVWGNIFTPLVTGAALSLLGGLVVLARWWSHVRQQRPSR